MAALPALCLGLMNLTGCYATVYRDTVNIAGLSVPPVWLAIGFLFFGLFGPATTLVALWMFRPFLFPPYYRLRMGDLVIEVWVSQRKYPLMAFPDALIVPVMSDLKMVFGAAKMARDWGANAAQYEANKVAPLVPGDAFIGPGAKYRWKMTGLAVIFDDQKRTTLSLMEQALRAAMTKAAHEGATSVMLPDMTENLLTQPNWITDAQREETACATARLMLDAIVASRGPVQNVKIWVFNPANADIFVAELEAMADAGRVPAPATEEALRAEH
jgi:hypothetical protein